jgi:exonuclease VII small subunit
MPNQSPEQLLARLKKGQQDLANARQQLAVLEGQIQAHSTALQRDFGVKTFEEGLALEKQLEGEIPGLISELEKALTEFESAFQPAKPA